MASLFLIVPFLSTLINGNSINQNNIAIFISNLFNLQSVSKTISIIAILISITTLLTNFIRAYSLKYSAKINAEITTKLSLNAFHNFLGSPYIQQIEKNSGDLITKFNYFNKLFSGILMPILYLISYAISISAIFIVLILSSPLAAFLVTSIILFFYIIIIFTTKSRVKKLSKILGKYNILHTRKLQEVIGGIKEINLKGNFNFFEDKYREIDKKIRISTAEIIFLNGIPKFLIEGFALSFIFCFLAIYSFTNEINNILPSIGLIALAFQKMIPAVQNSYSSFNTLRSNSFLLDAFEELLKKETIVIKKK